MLLQDLFEKHHMSEADLASVNWHTDVKQSSMDSADQAQQDLAEAPGAETLRHNQSTVSKNLDSLDLDEGDISQLEKDIADAPVAPIANMEADEKIGHMDADKFDQAINRLKQLAGAGPLKTVWDPQKRVYKNVPVALQPAQQPKK